MAGYIKYVNEKQKLNCAIPYSKIVAWELPFGGALKRIAVRPTKKLPKIYEKIFKQIFGDHNKKLVEALSQKGVNKQIHAMEELLRSREQKDIEEILIAIQTIYLRKTKPPIYQGFCLFFLYFFHSCSRGFISYMNIS